MTYTVWFRGRRIGDTRFELSELLRQRVGALSPTEFGLTVLPGITALFPALLEFAELCRRRGCDIDEDWQNAVTVTANAFSDTPQGRRVLAAAERIAELEVRDGGGDVVAWESLHISELDMLVPLSPSGSPMVQRRMRRLEGDPIRFMITMTLPSRPLTADRRRLTAADGPAIG